MNTTRRALTIPAALLLALMSVSFAVPGCATLSNAEKKIRENLPEILADVGQVSTVVSTAETWLNAYFAKHPNADQQQAVAAYVIRIDDALAGIQAIGRAAGDLDGANGQAALSELWNAYQAFAGLARTFGVAPVSAVPGRTGRVALVGGKLSIPAPGEFGIFARLKTARSATAAASNGTSSQDAIAYADQGALVRLHACDCPMDTDEIVFATNPPVRGCRTFAGKTVDLPADCQ